MRSEAAAPGSVVPPRRLSDPGGGRQFLSDHRRRILYMAVPRRDTGDTRRERGSGAGRRSTRSPTATSVPGAGRRSSGTMLRGPRSVPSRREHSLPRRSRRFCPVTATESRPRNRGAEPADLRRRFRAGASSRRDWSPPGRGASVPVRSRPQTPVHGAPGAAPPNSAGNRASAPADRRRPPLHRLRRTARGRTGFPGRPRRGRQRLYPPGTFSARAEGVRRAPLLPDGPLDEGRLQYVLWQRVSSSTD